MTTVENALEELHARIKASGNPSFYFSGQHPEIESLVGLLADQFLSSNASVKKQIQDGFKHPNDAAWYLLVYIKHSTQQLTDSNQTSLLTRALVAAALQGKNFEPRETDCLLQDLYKKAKAVGINPYPYFLKVASSASVERNFMGKSISDLLTVIAEKMFDAK